MKVDSPLLNVLGAATFAAFVFLPVSTASAQSPTTATTPTTVTYDGRGVTISGSDGVSRLNLRFRVQELMSATTKGETDYGIARTQFLIRRMRLRLEGVIRDPRLKVNLQLAFSRADMDLEGSGIVNIVRDANVSWQFTPSFSAMIGQAKLPSNRQQLISSSEIQAPDRTPLHATFTADRDVGVFATYAHQIGRARVQARGAVTSGEGRNPTTGNAGLGYTGRFEILPLGAFANNGDYVESDQAREPSLKLSFAGAIARNDGAVRTAGQTGLPLYSPRGMTTHYADLMAKKAGVMLVAEYAHRLSPDPITTSGSSTRYVYTGEGYTVRASYLLPHSQWEPQARFTVLAPGKAIRALSGAEHLEESAIGLARYVNGHRIKMNGDFTHSRFENLALLRKRGEWTLRTGFELGI